MGLDDLLGPESVMFHVKACCKREALQNMAARAEKLTSIPQDEILSTILEREQLGSTAVGDGVAIPHGKLEALGKITGILATVERPISFDAPDGDDVDIIFLLLAPAQATAAHLKALARTSRLLRAPEARAAIRGAESAEALYAIASSEQVTNAA